MSVVPSGTGAATDVVTPETLEAAQVAIGYRFMDLTILARALTHASVCESRLSSNERLEFLGDAILGMIACERIFDTFPDLLEGEMTKIKSVVVSRRACAQIGTRMDLAGLLLLGKGIGCDRDAIPQSMTAAALEAIIAAVYIDGGYEVARDWLAPLIDPFILQAEASGHQQNFKSVLQQHVQQHTGRTPNYRMISETGPDHAKSFKVCVDIAGESFAPAVGSSKKQAEQAAALKALEGLGLVERTAKGHVRILEPKLAEPKQSQPETADTESDDQAPADEIPAEPVISR